MAIDTFTNRLGLYESKAVVPVQDLVAGVYEVKMSTAGNSLLSTVYVETLGGGATVDVDYYDYGPGPNLLPGERLSLNSHTQIVVADTSDRTIVTSMHNNPRAIITVTGGPARLGLYVTVVATFASDLDASLNLDGTVLDLSKDKGIMTMCYDLDTGEAKFLPCRDDKLLVDANVTISAITDSTPIVDIPMAVAGTEYSYTIPANTKSFSLYNDSSAVLSYGFSVGGPYKPLFLRGCYERDGLTLASSITVYLKSTIDNHLAKLERWI